MKIRSVCIGVQLTPLDLVGTKGDEPIRRKLAAVADHLGAVSRCVREATGHEVQTCRVSTNSFEEWLLPVLEGPDSLPLKEVVAVINSALTESGIDMCSMGYCESGPAIEIAPTLLAMCGLLSCSVLFRRGNDLDTCPDYGKCLQTAKASLELAAHCGDLGNFRFCASFNCPGGIPFFPAAYCSSGSAGSSGKPVLTLGLENGDLLFLAFHGAGLPSAGSQGVDNTHSRAAAQLSDVLRQICVPIQRAARRVCEERGIEYGGMLFCL
jgi:hypothetical protein